MPQASSAAGASALSDLIGWRIAPGLDARRGVGAGQPGEFLQTRDAGDSGDRDGTSNAGVSLGKAHPRPTIDHRMGRAAACRLRQGYVTPESAGKFSTPCESAILEPSITLGDDMNDDDTPIVEQVTDTLSGCPGDTDVGTVPEKSTRPSSR